MDQGMFPLFIYCGFAFNPFSTFFVWTREYHYVNLTKTWAEAQRHCREEYTDLATFESMDDIGSLNRSHLDGEYVWIGLHDDPKNWREEMGQERNSWRWSMTEKPSTTGYQQWADGEPDNSRGGKFCVLTSNDGKWVARPCGFDRGFICYNAANAPGLSRYIMNRTKVTWKQAQESCRKHHTDLVTAENHEEQEMIMAVKSGVSASEWIGLYRVPWLWSDRSSSTFTNFKSGQPDNANNEQFCAAEQRDHQWIDENCDSQTPFLCYRETRRSVSSASVRMKMQSDADLSEASMKTQLVHKLGELLRIHSNTPWDLKWNIPPKKDEE